MHDDDAMDRLLRTALAGDAPAPSPAFDALVMRRVRPRRVTPRGRAVIAVYALAAAGITTWLMRDLPVASVTTAVALCSVVAAAASAYVGRLVIRQ
jgi:hypothetical protein